MKTNASLAALLPSSIRQAGVLRVGTVTDQAPMDMTTSSGSPAGMEIDLARALAGVLGLKAQFTETEFQGLIAGTLANRWDVIWAAMSDTAPREKQVTYVDYFSSDTTLLVKAGNPGNIASLSDFCGKTFGTQQSTIYAQMLQQISSQTCAGKSPIKIATFNDFATVFSALATGRVDAALQALEVAGYQAKQSAALEVVPKIQLQPTNYGIGMDPKNTGLIKAVQGALNELIKDGTYKQILAKYGLSSGAEPTATINKPTP